MLIARTLKGKKWQKRDNHKKKKNTFFLTFALQNPKVHMATNPPTPT